MQVLKWHCMLRFAHDPDNRPPSILITMLAAHAYNGELDLFTATRNALAGMGDHIENRRDILWIPNPAHEEENFADKWNEYPERHAALNAWHRDITGVLDDIGQMQGKGLTMVASRMAESFGQDAVEFAVRQYGNTATSCVATPKRALRMTTTGLLTTTGSGVTGGRHLLWPARRPARLTWPGSGSPFVQFCPPRPERFTMAS